MDQIKHKRIQIPFKARSLPSSQPKNVVSIMGFVKYDRDLKVIAVKLSLCGWTLARIDPEESKFVLAALDAKPTLYLDKIQSHIEAMTGTCHPLLTILYHLKFRLHLTKKVSRTVHPAQCATQRAEFVNRIGPYPTNYLVFLDECTVSLRTHSRNRAWAKRGR
ncbi:hypothetical protein PCASD_10537 [Puccinia coronata f. sp. avenae]|uniref:Uncharacterized protein n=1 Tax=Puccinia coronata f. sp. avenae TaxID=200324 RepID=A0A2N5TC67_9BASI|nr:hypothetical protein PCASD_10537 [Puccinia coronata f. sp. avenae]